jgi:hypothetical protein
VVPIGYDQLLLPYLIENRPRIHIGVDTPKRSSQIVHSALGVVVVYRYIGILEIDIAELRVDASRHIYVCLGPSVVVLRHA